jgi:putative addiction module killer protein
MLEATCFFRNFLCWKNEVPDKLGTMIKLKKTDEFNEWFKSLNEKEQVQIDARLDRIQSSAHFGDAKSLGSGLAELRWKNGWRIYFFKESLQLLILLLGGNKNAQVKDIKKARLLLRRYAGDKG